MKKIKEARFFGVCYSVARFVGVGLLCGAISSVGVISDSHAQVASASSAHEIDAVDGLTMKVPHHTRSGLADSAKEHNETLKVGPFYFRTKNNENVILGIHGQTATCLANSGETNSSGSLNARTEYLRMPGEPGNYDVFMQTDGTCLGSLTSGTKLGNIRVERQACAAGTDGYDSNNSYARWSHNAGFDVMRVLSTARRDETTVSCDNIRGVAVPADLRDKPYCLSNGNWDYADNSFCRYCRSDTSFRDTAPTANDQYDVANGGQWRRTCDANGNWEAIRKYCLAGALKNSQNEDVHFPEGYATPTEQTLTVTGDGRHGGAQSNGKWHWQRTCTADGWNAVHQKRCYSIAGFADSNEGNSKIHYDGISTNTYRTCSDHGWLGERCADRSYEKVTTGTRNFADIHVGGSRDLGFGNSARRVKECRTQVGWVNTRSYCAGITGFAETNSGNYVRYNGQGSASRRLCNDNGWQTAHCTEVGQFDQTNVGVSEYYNDDPSASRRTCNLAGWTNAHCLADNGFDPMDVGSSAQTKNLSNDGRWTRQCNEATGWDTTERFCAQRTTDGQVFARTTLSGSDASGYSDKQITVAVGNRGEWRRTCRVNDGWSGITKVCLVDGNYVETSAGSNRDYHGTRRYCDANDGWGTAYCRGITNYADTNIGDTRWYDTIYSRRCGDTGFEAQQTHGCAANGGFANTLANTTRTNYGPRSQAKRPCNSNNTWGTAYCPGITNYNQVNVGQQSRHTSNPAYYRTCNSDGFSTEVMDGCSGAHGLPVTGKNRWASSGLNYGYCDGNGNWTNVMNANESNGIAFIDYNNNSFPNGYGSLVQGGSFGLNQFRAEGNSHRYGCPGCINQLVFGFEGATAADLTCVNGYGGDVDVTDVVVKIPDYIGTGNKQIKMWGFQQYGCDYSNGHPGARELAANGGGVEVKTVYVEPKPCAAAHGLPQTEVNNWASSGNTTGYCNANSQWEQVVTKCGAEHGLPATNPNTWAGNGSVQAYCDGSSQWKHVLHANYTNGIAYLKKSHGSMMGGGVTFSCINGRTYNRGDTVRVSAFWARGNSHQYGCPGCINQIVMGFEGATASELTCVNGYSGNVEIINQAIDLIVPQSASGQTYVKIWGHQQYSCNDAKNLAANGGGTSIGTYINVTPPVPTPPSSGTYGNVTVHGQMWTHTAKSPGSTLSLSNFTAVGDTRSWCPGCINQVVISVGQGGTASTSNMYCQSGYSGYVSYSSANITVPSTPGTYEVRARGFLQYTCDAGIDWSGHWGARALAAGNTGTLIGHILVQ